MRRSSLITLGILGVGGSALAATTFGGGSCERVYPALDQCVAAHGAGNCTTQTREGPDGKSITVALGPNRNCSAWNNGSAFFLPGYYGGYGYYGGGYHGNGSYWSGRGYGGSTYGGTSSSGVSGGSTRGGFGGTGSSFSSGS